MHRDRTHSNSRHSVFSDTLKMTATHETSQMGTAVASVEGPSRPTCLEFALDFLGEPEAPIVEAYLIGLEDEVAHLHNVLATITAQHGGEVGGTKRSDRRTATHQKRAYRAVCTQWDGANTAQVIALLGDATQYGDNIMCRHHLGISTLRVGDWVVVGENGEIKTYRNEVFHVKYEKINSAG